MAYPPKRTPFKKPPEGVFFNGGGDVTIFELFWWKIIMTSLEFMKK